MKSARCILDGPDISIGRQESASIPWRLGEGVNRTGNAAASDLRGIRHIYVEGVRERRSVRRKEEDGRIAGEQKEGIIGYSNNIWGWLGGGCNSSGGDFLAIVLLVRG